MSEVMRKAYAQEKEKGYDYRRAMEEAARCLLCEDAPCSAGCPAATDPGKFIRSLRFKNIRGAAETIRENNPLGACCAWVCPYDRMCEKECSRSGIDRPIQIGRLQRFLMEEEKRENMAFLPVVPATGKKVACIGAGPASLACARDLALAGVQVTVYESREKAGGVLSFGITPTRLPQEVVDQDVAQIERLGVKFVFGKKVDKAGLEKLQKENDAVFVGVGLWGSKTPGIKGEELKGVESALDFLEQARTSGGQVGLSPEDTVLIIGGGNVAMDCVATAKQLGTRAMIVYRRTIEEAPADIEEIRFVQNMGVPIFTEFAPEEILGKDGKVAGLKCKSRDGYSEMTLKADRIIFAIGQTQVAEYQDLKTAPGLFVGGDASHPAGITVVESVAEGKAAALDIVKFLG